jgi:hypothetical protein
MVWHVIKSERSEYDPRISDHIGNLLCKREVNTQTVQPVLHMMLTKRKTFSSVVTVLSRHKCANEVESFVSDFDSLDGVSQRLFILTHARSTALCNMNEALFQQSSNDKGLWP